MFLNTYFKKKKPTNLLQTVLEINKKDYTFLHILWGRYTRHPQTQDDTRMEDDQNPLCT